jgi:hypothetical protein
MNAPLTDRDAATLLRLTLDELHRQTESPRVPRHGIDPELQGQLTQLLVQIRGRGDAGHLLHRVNRIESIMRALNNKDSEK